MADLLERPMSVHFSTKFIKRVSHDEILESIKEKVDISNIKAIQITERECIISLANEDAKVTIMVGGLRVQNRNVSVTEVNKIITNVTLKDAPYEMSDDLLIQRMNEFGDVVEGSLTRGKIKNTNIENGTRYMKILDCAPILPPDIDIGQFKIRLYADNNRTACKICGNTDHPYFKCPNKSSDQRSAMYSEIVKNRQTRTCYNCKSTEHTKRDCPYDTICHACMKEGHIQSECPFELYGEYADEIIEGRLAQKEDSEVRAQGNSHLNSAAGNAAEAETATVTQNVTNEKTNTSGEDIESTPSRHTEPQNIKQKVGVVLGDSNTVRMHVKDKNFKNVSISGQSLNKIENAISKVKVNDNEMVSAVIIHLGTNDISNCKTDDTIDMAKKAMKLVANKWPNTPVAFSSIMPRRGKGKLIKAINDDAIVVNKSVLELCKSTRYYHYLDNDQIFLENDKFQAKLYDERDIKGVHVNDEGAERLYENFLSFFNEGESDEMVDQTPSIIRKRGRGSSSSTPPSANRITKHGRNDL
jgi:hypothetical protein